MGGSRGALGARALTQSQTMQGLLTTHVQLPSGQVARNQTIVREMERRGLDPAGMTPMQFMVGAHALRLSYFSSPTSMGVPLNSSQTSIGSGLSGVHVESRSCGGPPGGSVQTIGKIRATCVNDMMDVFKKLRYLMTIGRPDLEQTVGPVIRIL
jgi:hypothetical protein